MFCNRLISIPHDSRVVADARSLFFPGTLDAAVLLIHGFTGIPNEMEFLGRRLSEAGFAVAIPRLPGHGTNVHDFRASGARDWLRRSVDAYLELASQYSVVYVAGLSMGGLIAVLLASQFSVPRIVLAAPAFLTSIPFLWLAPLARYFVTRIPNSRYVEEENTGVDPELRDIKSEYARYRWVSAAAELRILQRRARARLGKVESGVLTIVSKADRTVPARVGDLVERRISSSDKRIVVLERSGHVVVDGIEKEYVAEEIIAWFRR